MAENVTKDDLTSTTSDTDTTKEYEGVFKGEFEGTLTGGATTAKSLEKPCRITVTGDATGYTDFTGNAAAQIDLTVTHATKADRADYAGQTANCERASLADHSNTAEYAYNTGKAKEADHATEADHSTEADHATKADSATNSTYAESATEASHSSEADHATKADEATHAESSDESTHATEADHALKADEATHSATADLSTMAVKAGIADIAKADSDGNIFQDTYVKNDVGAFKTELLKTCTVGGKASGSGTVSGTVLTINIESLGSAVANAFKFYTGEFADLELTDADRVYIYVNTDAGEMWIYDTSKGSWQNLFVKLSGDISQLKTDMSDVKTEISTTVDEKISTLQSTVTTQLEVQNASIATQLSEQNTAINTKIEEQNTAVDNKLTSVDTKLSTLTVKTSGHNNIRTPYNLSPVGDVLVVATLSAAAFESNFTDDTKAKRVFEITSADDVNFENILETHEVQGESFTFTYAGRLTPNTSYLWRCYDVSSYGYQSEYSEVCAITTGDDIRVLTPTVTIKEDVDGAYAPVHVTTSDFAVLGGLEDTHTSTRWVLTKIDSEGNETVVSDTSSETDLTSTTLAFDLFEVSTKYRISASHTGAIYSNSDLGSLEFTTASVLQKPNMIGTANTPGFGVGICPDENLPSNFTGMEGYADPTSDNYGNYVTDKGDVFVYIPRFAVRVNSTLNATYSVAIANSLDIIGADKWTTIEDAESLRHRHHFQ